MVTLCRAAVLRWRASQADGKHLRWGSPQSSRPCSRAYIQRVQKSAIIPLYVTFCSSIRSQTSRCFANSLLRDIRFGCFLESALYTAGLRSCCARVALYFAFAVSCTGFTIKYIHTKYNNNNIQLRRFVASFIVDYL